MFMLLCLAGHVHAPWLCMLVMMMATHPPNKQCQGHADIEGWYQYQECYVDCKHFANQGLAH
jgi:hypothetical protein